MRRKQLAGDLGKDHGRRGGKKYQECIDFSNLHFHEKSLFRNSSLLSPFAFACHFICIYFLFNFKLISLKELVFC